MQPNELDALGVSTDLTTAARALGISKSTAYASARAGSATAGAMADSSGMPPT